ncbi:TRAP transporter substrate-binding protein [Exilibacterium tricleocarpae]|uniref:TRAP transporter substrate-binding protein n=1 Tax=Exilibacterium tricleocarpae TaxID=2591008 RepID=A0A545UA25_9GAMM|nr:TRAP transporter substrate-binding protein [Exilibacterium tricleocarpae]TQV86328.1 TRAP transporter substrate-binding protein [Exilibacterium tricleocarpae]
MAIRPVAVLTCLLCVLALLSAGCTDSSAVRRIKLAHGLDTSHPVHKGMEYLAARAAEKSAGQLIVEIYPSQQLGTERQTLELLQIGSIGMTKVSAAVLENFAPNLKVFSLPYIFNDRAHSFAVLDGPIGKELLLQPQRYWLRGLTYYDAGSRSFYTKGRPVRTPDDLAGLKIRVQPSVTAMDMVRAFGGSPTPIAWGELYTSLQQGVVDGAENNPPSFYLSRHYEVCKYYSLNEHTQVPDVLLISTIIWERLSPQEQDWLQAAADESAVYQRRLWAESERESLAAVAAAGVEILRPDPQPFADKVKALFAEYEKDPELSELIRRIREFGS